MKKQIDQVREFHEAFGVDYHEKPTMPEMNRRILRHHLIAEELNEFAEACEEGNLVEVADALTDLAYVVFGSMIEFGLGDKAEELFEEVQRSNMSKLGEDGKPVVREDGKILKGEGYFKPDLKTIIEK